MNKCCGAKLAAAGTAIAIQIAIGLSTDDINILGALFNVIGDQLALIAAAEVSGQSNDNNSNNNSNNNRAASAS